MIRVLIADDQKTIRKLLTNFLADERDIDLVGVADNGKIAVELIDKLCPDVVLLDLHMPILDGLSVTQTITKSYEKTKTIIFSSQENEQFVAQTIIAGANGYLLKKSPIENVTKALRTVLQGKYYLDPELTASNVLNKQLPAIPRASLDNWTYWFAQEIVTIWRCQVAKQNSSVSEFLTDIELTTNSENDEAIAPIIFRLEENSGSLSLFKKLSLHLDLLQKSVWTKNDTDRDRMFLGLSEAEAEIKNWFENSLFLDEWNSNIFLPKLSVQEAKNNIFVAKGEEWSTKFTNSIDFLWQHAGSQVILKWLEELNDNLHAIKVNYKNRSQSYIQKETSAWSAFLIFKNRLIVSNKEARNIENWEAAWKAILFAYKFKLYSQLYSYAIERIVIELIDRVREYKSIIVQTENLLLDLQFEFKAKTNVTHDSMLLLSNLTELTKPMKIRRELESQLGFSLNYWGTLPSERQIIKEEIIARSQSLANKLYIECCDRAISPSDDAKKFLN